MTKKNQILEDSLKLLEVISTSEQPLGCRELGRRLEISPAKVTRLLQSLTGLGLVASTEKKKYFAGPAIHVLSAQALHSSPLTKRAFEVMKNVLRRDCIIAIGVLWRDKVSYIFHAQPGMPIWQGVGRVGLYPASECSIGQLLLSYKSDEELEEIFQARDIPGFDSLDHLKEHLRSVNKAGYSQIKERAGQHIAVPIGGKNPNAALAYISLPLSTNIDETTSEMFHYASRMG